jgi:hypothetical protein
MENKNTFGTLRLHKETIERLKNVKRETESKMKKDLLWDEFVELLIGDYTKDE